MMWVGVVACVAVAFSLIMAMVRLKYYVMIRSHIFFYRTQGRSLSTLVNKWLTDALLGDLNDVALVKSGASCLMNMMS